jgi:hypothetical protein
MQWFQNKPKKHLENYPACMACGAKTESACSCLTPASNE